MATQARPQTQRSVQMSIGVVLSVVVVLFMLMDATMHMVKPVPVVDAFVQLGFPVSLAAGLGIVTLCCVTLYAIPRTSVLGAIMLTGYLGGAVAVNVRVGHPAFETLFPVIVGVLAWGGLFLRDARVRDLIAGSLL